MRKRRTLPSDSLRRTADEKRWAFETSDDIDGLDGFVGQERAEEALRFGVGVAAHGYNLFALGPPGLGKHKVILGYLEEVAADLPPGPDICYVQNFRKPRRPAVLVLPTGRGGEFQDAMKEVVESLSEAIPVALQADEFKASQQAIEENFRRRQEEAIEGVRERAKKYDIAVIRTPSGVVMAPMEDGEIVAPGEFQDRPEAERDRFEERLEQLHRELEQTMTRLPRWERERKRRLDELERGAVETVVRAELLELRVRFAGLSEVQGYLDDLEEDLLQERSRFVGDDDLDPMGLLGAPPNTGDADWRRRYEVNLLVDRSDDDGAPVVREHNPTLENLVGRVDHLARFGALTTDFTMIRPGALHRANGGYLVVDARDLLTQPLGWEQLKRALRSKEIRIESPAQILGVLSTVTLEPTPVKLDVKVVLVGDRWIFELLQRFDPDFDDLFKVIVDFEEDSDRADREDSLLRFLARQIEEARLRPFHASALAEVVDEAARFSGRADRVTLHTEKIRDLLVEADHIAGARSEAAEIVERADVQAAVEARDRRRDRLFRRRIEAVARDELKVPTTGREVAQVNGLAVMENGGFRFGMPSRISASVRLGSGDVVDIEREVDLGGAIHSKGVLILQGYLGALFGRRRPLKLMASLVFEQSYGSVDGDSASLAETVAVLSALAHAPVYQSRAVTGSIDQRGQVQAVGGINEKIEGFYELCRRVEWTGDQGVIIPASCADHLMLKREIVDAVDAKEFSVWVVDTVAEAAELLTNVPAGVPSELGEFEDHTLFGRVAAKLDEFAETSRRWAGPYGGG